MILIRVQVHCMAKYGKYAKQGYRKCYDCKTVAIRRQPRCQQDGRKNCSIQRHGAVQPERLRERVVVKHQVDPKKPNGKRVNRIVTERFC